MNTHRIAAIAMSMALAGLTHTLAAEENIPAISESEVYQQTAAEQQTETGSFMSERDMPGQTVSQPADNLLSDLKIYPSF